LLYEGKIFCGKVAVLLTYIIQSQRYIENSSLADSPVDESLSLFMGGWSKNSFGGGKE
jgi:hypothetical protein